MHALLATGIGTLAIGAYVLRTVNEQDPIVTIADFASPGMTPSAPAPPSVAPAARDDAKRADEFTPDASFRDRLADQLAQKDADRAGEAGPDTIRAAPSSNTSPSLRLPGPPPASFAGLRAANAGSIVYVVDASGSMIGTLPVVLEELERSLRRLTAAQRFAVIFFQRNRTIEPQEFALQQATSASIGATMRWARSAVRPAGRSNPLTALDRALDLRPEVIFVLSTNITGSGEFEMTQDELLGRLDNLNPRDGVTQRRNTRIQCVQFLDPDPLDTLRTIAERHGGLDGFRFLSREALGLMPSSSAAP